jgi:uncharacterized protein (DUF433 family)
MCTNSFIFVLLHVRSISIRLLGVNLVPLIYHYYFSFMPPYIFFDPEIRFGKPCIVGTRIAVQDILGWLASGMSFEEIIEDFPELDVLKIRAALSFAAHRELRTKILFRREDAA